MSNHSDTTRQLSQITDEGLFERLAASVLRQASPDLYANLTQPGVNPDGKTVKSPVDAISFVSGASPPHMVVAHHTCGAAKTLESKWLHDPSRVTPRTGSKPTAPAGDVIKTMEIVKDERSRVPNLCVTLALTTTKEPGQDLTRLIQQTATSYKINIDIWSGARIAHHLDNTPDGQWLRKQYLGINQHRLSKSLLQELSHDSLSTLPLMARTDILISRQVDDEIAERAPRPVAFLVGESGFGKTVACYRHLKAHVDAGGCGLVIGHETLESVRTLDQAIDVELRSLYPDIESDAGAKARALCSPDDPILILVEDLSRSERPALLLERLAAWSAPNATDAPFKLPEWELLCPVWPQILLTASQEVRKRIDSISVPIPSFTKDEAKAAIQQRALIEGVTLSSLETDTLVEALGNDPLLIGLYDFDQRLKPQMAIAAFVNGSLERIASREGRYLVTEYRAALMTLGNRMLQNLQLNPNWAMVRQWFTDNHECFLALREILKSAEVIRLIGDEGVESLWFRHDRVRTLVLTQSISEQMQRGILGDVISEPYLSDVVGGALASSSATSEIVDQVQKSNPLALFYALRAFRLPSTNTDRAIVDSIRTWLQTEEIQSPRHYSLQLAALTVLVDTDSPHTLEIARLFPGDAWGISHVRFRNGEADGGFELCLQAPPGVSAPWRDFLIEHARLHFGQKVSHDVIEALRHSSLLSATFHGALRLAGFLADPSFEKAIKDCWERDSRRAEHLTDYLWAGAQCCGEDPDYLLGAICDEWAALPEESPKEGYPSPRDDLAANEISWAFSRSLPKHALQYFISRAEDDSLRWPITYMLRAIDHPDAVSFVAQEIAAISRRMESSGVFSDFGWSLPRDWERRQQENGQAMSSASRARLQSLWTDTENDKHLRRSALRLWAATQMPDDLKLLQANESSDILADDLLTARLKRGDQTAIPTLIEKLNSDSHSYWWQMGREIWSDDLTVALNDALEKRSEKAEREWGSLVEPDWILTEMVANLNPEGAEQILVFHWEHIKYSPMFVQVAIYTESHRTRELAKGSIAASPDPREMLKHIDRFYRASRHGRSNSCSLEQIKALVPYLEYLEPSDVYRLWDICNRRGWFDFRRAELDGRLDAKWRERAGVDDVSFEAELDRQVDSKYPYAELWLERIVDPALSRSDIIRKLGSWLSSRQSIGALKFAADVVAITGNREDVKILEVPGIEPREQADAIVASARFSVCLRSLN